MPALNHVAIIGNLGRDPELRFTKQGKAVANFSVAINEQRGDAAHTEWVNVVAWEKTAENCEKFLSKGSLVYVDGRLATREWEKDGEKRKSTEIVASRVQFLDKKGEGPERIEGGIRKGGDNPLETGGSSEVPF